MTSQLSLDQSVPSFTLVATGDKQITLPDNAHHVVLYFYPKDSTPGCTTEGQNFRDLKAEFDQYNTVIYGISRDSLRSHENFKAKQEYNFDLLVDDQEEACKIFDVIKEKNMYGKKVFGIERSTFIIDNTGKLVKEWRKVKVDGHAQAVLDSVKELFGET